MTLEQEIKALETRFKKPITKFDRGNWEYVVTYCKPSENLLIKFKDKMGKDAWTYVPVYNINLTEDFIIKYGHLFNPWSWVAIKQKISYSFIQRFKDRLFYPKEGRWSGFLKSNKQISKNTKAMLRLNNINNKSLIGYFDLNEYNDDDFRVSHIFNNNVLEKEIKFLLTGK